MTYILVTGPMGAGKSTFMRSLPRPQGNFTVPRNPSSSPRSAIGLSRIKVTLGGFPSVPFPVLFPGI